MGYELYYEGRISFDRPVRLDRPDEEDRLTTLTRFFTPVFQQAEGTSTGRNITGFQVDEATADWAKPWLWQADLTAIEAFARSRQATLTAQLRWQGDGCPSNPADDRGHVVFDLHGQHHQVPDSNRAVEAHRRRSCTCYPAPASHPTPAPSPAQTDVLGRAASVLAAAGLTILDADSDGTGLRIRPAEPLSDHPHVTLVAPVVNGREGYPPYPQHTDRRSTWAQLMKAARNALTAAGWERIWEEDTGGEFSPPSTN